MKKTTKIVMAILRVLERALLRNTKLERLKLSATHIEEHCINCYGLEHSVFVDLFQANISVSTICSTVDAVCATCCNVKPLHLARALWACLCNSL
jgi:hypothetical protein